MQRQFPAIEAGQAQCLELPSPLGQDCVTTFTRRSGHPVAMFPVVSATVRR
jgi:hypothetical protein